MVGRRILGVSAAIAPLLAMVFASAATPVSIARAAEESAVTEPAQPAASARKHARKPRRHAENVTARPANLEARHEVCLAFIRRHGLSCDPWQQPTCGYDLGYFRPLECVAP